MPALPHRTGVFALAIRTDLAHQRLGQADDALHIAKERRTALGRTRAQRA